MYCESNPDDHSLEFHLKRRMLNKKMHSKYLQKGPSIIIVKKDNYFLIHIFQMLAIKNQLTQWV